MWQSSNNKVRKVCALMDHVEPRSASISGRNFSASMWWMAPAWQVAAQEIDRLSDPSTSDEERQPRKRRLIKGPKKFGNIRKQSRED
jgi:hypothetical protein